LKYVNDFLFNVIHICIDMFTNETLGKSVLQTSKENRLFNTTSIDLIFYLPVVGVVSLDKLG